MVKLKAKKIKRLTIWDGGSTSYWLYIVVFLQAVKKLGLWGLFTRGLPLRIVMIGTLTGAQWGIYDAFKVMVGL